MTKRDINEIFDNDKNGANLENRTAKILIECGWNIKENQPYIDPATGKQREIDIIAIKTYKIGEKNYFITNPEIFEIRLFIDCKNIPNGAGLYIKNKSIENAHAALLNKKTYAALYGEEFNSYNKIIDYKSINHRYFINEQIAYKSINNDDRNIGFQGANQVINAMYSKFYYSNEKWSLDYPVIIVNDIYSIGLENENSERSFASNNLLYSIDSIPDGKNKETFIIDIVGIELLEGFLIELDTEINFLKEKVFNFILHSQTEDKIDDNISDNFWNSNY